MRGADGFIGAPWPTVSAQPGHRSAFLSEDFVGYCLSFLSAIVFTIVPFPILNVNQKRWAIYRLGVQSPSQMKD